MANKDIIASSKKNGQKRMNKEKGTQMKMELKQSMIQISLIDVLPKPCWKTWKKLYYSSESIFNRYLAIDKVIPTLYINSQMNKKKVNVIQTRTKDRLSKEIRLGLLGSIDSVLKKR